MFFLFTPLLLLLAFPTLTGAAIFVPFDDNHISLDYVMGLDTYQGEVSVLSLQACIDLANARTDGRGPTGFIFSASDQYCFTYTKYYPALCSGYAYYAGWVGGMEYRCSSTPGYVMSGDGSCIYTGGTPLTGDAYAQACPTRYGAPASLASPAYKRKRRVVEPSPFVGGKVCPIGEQACPLSSSNALECINVKVNLGSCGGCLVGKGVDCSDLPGTNEVSCRSGQCIVDSCFRGWTLSTDGTCVEA